MAALIGMWDAACTPLDGCNVERREGPTGLVIEPPRGFRPVSEHNQWSVKRTQAVGSKRNHASFDFWIPELSVASQGAGSWVPELHSPCEVAHEGGGPVSATAVVLDKHGLVCERPEPRGDAGPSSRQDEGITITAGGTVRDEDPAWQAIKRAAGTEHARDIFNTIHAFEPTRSRGMQEGADNSLHLTPEPGHSRTNLRRRINEVRKINMPRRIAPLTAQQRQRLGLDRRTSHDEDGMLM